MGDDLLSIAQQIGMLSPHHALLSEPPGAVQELKWRAQFVRPGVASGADSVARLAFSFYEDQLFRIVIDYQPERTEGMTEGDMVAAISAIYGQPSKRAYRQMRAGLQASGIDTVIAQWADGDSSIALLAVEGQAAFQMIVSSMQLEALARAAATDAIPTDPAELLSVAAHNVDIEKTPSSREKTRRTNIASFTP